MNNPSLKIFSIVFGFVYIVCFYVDLAVFRYYPETNHFYWTMHTADGPAILWYGWLTTALLVTGAITLVVPRQMADRVSNDLVWIAPLLATAIILVYERQWYK